MGGKNHQPCSGYLKNSTRLSRHLSLAIIALETANVKLEDLILDELEDRVGSTDAIITGLKNSMSELDRMMEASTALRLQMDENGFEDLPSLRSIDLTVIGRSLNESGRVDATAWSEAATIMNKQGFYGMLDTFDAQIKELKRRTSDLIDLITAIDSSSGEVHRILEENRHGNIRPTFAEVYTAWGTFNALFLASSLISTELWYSFNNYGSLTDDAANRQIA